MTKKTGGVKVKIGADRVQWLAHKKFHKRI